MNKALLNIVALVLAFGLGIFVYANWRNANERTLRQSEATILLERIEEVMKLVTVEGSVSELYNETQTRRVTLYLPLPTAFDFDKKATVQVTGKVLVGYDLEKLSLRIDENQQKLIITDLPEPEILAIDHELAYRNLEESWFNNFTAQDYTALNQSAKRALRDKALESELMVRARQQGRSVIESISQLARAAGLEVEIIEQPSLSEPEQKPEIIFE